jgi:hypothetical protein
VQLQLTLRISTIEGEPRAAAAVMAEGALINTGPQPITVDLVEIGSASLALEIVDDGGSPVPMPPPPTPGRSELAVVEPGARRTVVFRSFVPPGARAGRYRARLRYRDARSPWVAFVVP